MGRIHSHDRRAAHRPAPAERAAAIAHLADGFPFYIHHIVKALKYAAGAAPAGAVAVSINELLAEGRAAGTLDDRERLIDLLRLMEQDQDLAPDANGDYRFRFPLLQRWWRLARGL
ncbi:hypothetical protein [Thiocystis violacea]|uniref:hypothetical protein n=1 Tax=Thiocystis violacea TaxID=13725 RepID=UPI001F5B78F2|nr:hypothetical protein [Thiocystis violacea]